MPEIRELNTQDAEIFRRLRLLSLSECPTAFGASHAHEAKLELADFEKRLDGKIDRWVLGAFVGDALVGIVGFGRDEAEKVRHRGFVWGMYVDLPWRDQGIGRALLEATLVRADKLEGLRNIRLGVTNSNLEARRLYESLGFVNLYLEHEYLFVDGEFHSMLLMSRPTMRSPNQLSEPTLASGPSPAGQEPRLP